MILLLTGCINPQGMSYTSLTDTGERQRQYIEAIHFYLSHTKYPIVFTENSGTDISSRFKAFISSGRLEYLTFHGNQNKQRGKGYGECEIIEYALSHSQMIHNHQNKYIAKITGRLIVRNITSIARFHTFIWPRQTVFCAINSDLSFPDSRLIIAPLAFYSKFLENKDKIDDKNGYFFEHALCDTLKGNNFSYSPFFICPHIKGMSGSTGEYYTEKPRNISFHYRYAKFAFSQRRRFLLLAQIKST